MTDKHIGETAERALADKLDEVFDALDDALGDTDPPLWDDMTDEEVRDEHPVFWACQRLAMIRDEIRTAPLVAEGGKEYRAVTIEDAEKVRTHFGGSAGLHWIQAQRTMLAALQAIGAVVPAHPSPEVRAVKEETK